MANVELNFYLNSLQSLGTIEYDAKDQVLTGEADKIPFHVRMSDSWDEAFNGVTYIAYRDLEQGTGTSSDGTLHRWECVDKNVNFVNAPSLSTAGAYTPTASLNGVTAAPSWAYNANDGGMSVRLGRALQAMVVFYLEKDGCDERATTVDPTDASAGADPGSAHSTAGFLEIKETVDRDIRPNNDQSSQVITYLANKTDLAAMDTNDPDQPNTFDGETAPTNSLSSNTIETLIPVTKFATAQTAGGGVKCGVTDDMLEAFVEHFGSTGRLHTGFTAGNDAVAARPLIGSNFIARTGEANVSIDITYEIEIKLGDSEDTVATITKDEDDGPEGSNNSPNAIYRAKKFEWHKASPTDGAGGWVKGPAGPSEGVTADDPVDNKLRLRVSYGVDIDDN